MEAGVDPATSGSLPRPWRLGTMTTVSLDYCSNSNRYSFIYTLIEMMKERKKVKRKEI
jgi:hypothetical protein